MVVAGKPGEPEFQKALHAVHNQFQPNRVILGNAGPVEEFAKTLPEEKESAVYLCTGSACHPPTSSALKLLEMMASKTLPCPVALGQRQAPCIASSPPDRPTSRSTRFAG